MSASVEAADVPGDRASTAATATADHAPVHQHAWGPTWFELVDQRPLVRERCESCGFVRGYRAWERYWTPGEGEIRR